MKYVAKKGKLKQRGWAVVRVDGKTFSVKVMHLAGMHQLSFMARRRKKDPMELYHNADLLEIVKDPKTIKKLQVSYYS